MSGKKPSPRRVPIGTSARELAAIRGDRPASARQQSLEDLRLST